MNSTDRPPTGAETRQGKQAMLEAMRSERLWPEGSRHTCPDCRSRTLRGRSDLHVQVARANTVHVFRHLHGAKCNRCGAQVLEPYEDIAIEGELVDLFVADYEAKVTNIGSNTVGTYWPKDVQRLAGLRKGRRLRIQVLDRDTLLLRVE
jgi:DNA-directed RNA polymerase subunit RPC12/RpoP